VDSFRSPEIHDPAVFFGELDIRVAVSQISPRAALMAGAMS